MLLARRLWGQTQTWVIRFSQVRLLEDYSRAQSGHPYILLGRIQRWPQDVLKVRREGEIGGQLVAIEYFKDILISQQRIRRKRPTGAEAEQVFIGFEAFAPLRDHPRLANMGAGSI